MEKAIKLAEPIIDIEHEKENLFEVWDIPLAPQIVDEAKHIGHTIAAVGGEVMEAISHEFNLDETKDKVENPGATAPPIPETGAPLPEPTGRKPSHVGRLLHEVPQGETIGEEVMGDLATIGGRIAKLAGSAVEGVKHAFRHDYDKTTMQNKVIDREAEMECEVQMMMMGAMAD